MAVDLHVHSTASDGTLSPEEVVQVAVAAGLKAVALTDHDTIAGVEPAMQAAEAMGMELFPAVEISAMYGRREVHILGYFIDLHDPDLTETLNLIQDNRRSRAGRMVERLQGLGLPISEEDVRAHVEGESVGRPHVAAALVGLGLVRQPQEAFERYLRRGRPAYVERLRLDARQAIELVRAAGGLPALGHPGLLRQDSILPDLVQMGLGALEAYHVDHTPAQTEKYLLVADRLGIIITGGSDSHGPEGPKPVAIGQVHVPDSCAEALRRWDADRRPAVEPVRPEPH